MAAITSARRLASFLCLWTLTLGDTENMVAVPGQTVSLQCLIAKDKTVKALLWRRPDLNESDGCVFFFRENRTYESFQIPYFRDRVKLSDPGMKNGNVSLTLSNVNANDTGTYECHVIVSSTGRSKRTTELRKTVTLTVNAGHTDESSREHPGLIAAVAVVLVMAVSLITLRHMKKKSSPPSSSSSSSSSSSPPSSPLSLQSSDQLLA